MRQQVFNHIMLYLLRTLDEISILFPKIYYDIIKHYDIIMTFVMTLCNSSNLQFT